MKIDLNIYDAIIRVITSVLEDENIRATKYLSSAIIVRATRRLVHGRIQLGNIEVIVTIGKPNYAEREFIKLCKKAKEPFPVKNIQLKLYNPKPTKLKRK